VEQFSRVNGDGWDSGGRAKAEGAQEREVGRAKANTWWEEKVWLSLW
jgi:hypothetical protein